MRSHLNPAFYGRRTPRAEARSPRLRWAVLKAVLTATILLGAGNGLAAPVCPADAQLPELSLPHFSAALAERREAVIVALGSSSTQGVAATAAARTYPAVLQAELSAELPEAHVAVINRGIGGQDVASELARLDTDVLAVRPQLVIWQVGANAVLHGDDPTSFRRQVIAGVRRLRQAGADVVMMDNQRAPRLLASPADQIMDRALAAAAKETGAGLFSRDRLMAHWEQQGVMPAAFVAHDSLHLNDRGYFCTARSLSRAIAAAVASPTPTAFATPLERPHEP